MKIKVTNVYRKVYLSNCRRAINLIFYNSNRVVISGDLSVTDISDGISTPAKVDVATGSAQSLIAANTNRKEIIVQNTGVYELWVGDANIDPPTNRGIKIVANDSITLATTAQLYGEAVTGATIASLLELTKS